MKLDVYVNYPGTCEAAFRYYEAHLGAKVVFLTRHGEQPGRPNIPADWADKVLHARLALGGTIFMGADIPAAQPMRSAYATLTLDSVAEAERVYDRLADGGEIFMKMAETPFAKRFAMLRDRFGTSWMLLHEAGADG
jgi:PhnB protein